MAHEPSPARTWLPVVGLILLVAALRFTRPVTMPLAFAVFLVILVWPLQETLERRLPRWLATLSTLLVVVVTASVFFGGIAWALEAAIREAPFYARRLEELLRDLDAALPGTPLTDGGSIDPTAWVDQAIGLIAPTVGILSAALAAVVLISVFMVLVLVEVRAFRRRLRSNVDQPLRGRLLVVSSDIARRFRRFFLTRSLTSALTGLLTFLFCWILGIDLAIVWGVTAFLLNYVPTLGSIVAVIPPVLIALLQTGSLLWATLTAAGLTVIQLAVGNVLDPRLQGRYLQISPLMVLFSIVFWGWVWGIPGALLGVPLTVAIVVLCEHFPSTRWISGLLSDPERPLPKEEPS